MRVAVDARQVYRSQRRGIGKTLIDLYATLAVRRPGWRFVLFHQSGDRPSRLTGLRNVVQTRLDFLGADRLNAWEQAVLPAASLATGADVIHSPANTAPRYAAAPVVVNIHDLIPVEMAPNDPAARAWLARVRAAGRRASRVITGSEYSKERIIEWLGLPPEKITVCPWAPDCGSRPVNDPVELNRVRATIGLRPDEPYVFGFGAADPRKNTRRVLEAYAALPVETRATVRLVLVGIQEPALSELRVAVGEMGIAGRVALRGFTNEDDLPALMSGAMAMCYLSLYEGFGLPVLDAFACGTPVLAGNRTSLPEVAGDAALLVDPCDTDAIRDGLFRLMTDPALRDDLRERGAERVREFTWERTTEAIAGVFEAAVEG